MNTLQLTNAFLSLLATNFFLLTLKKSKSIEKGLDKPILQYKGLLISYSMPASILLYICSFSLSMWGEIGLSIIQLFSFLGAVGMMSSSYKIGKVDKVFNLNTLKGKLESLEYGISFITKSYLTEWKDATRKSEDLKGLLDELELKFSNLSYDVAIDFDKLRKNVLDIEDKQVQCKRDVISLNSEINSVNSMLTDSLREFKDDYKREVVDLSENIKSLNEAISELKVLLTPVETNEIKVTKPYMDPYIKAYLEG